MAEKPVRVTAGHLRDEELGVEVVVFATPDGESLEVSRALGTVEDPRVCVSSNTGRTSYAGISSCSVDGLVLRLVLDPVCAEEMDLDPVVLLEVDDAGALEEVLPHLRRLVAGP